MIHIFLLLCGISLGFVKTQSDLEDIDNFIQEVMEFEEVPGLSIAVVKDGEPYLVKGYGVKDIYTGEPVDEDTLFYTASTGKAMTGVLVAKAVQQSVNLTLDSPVKSILGEEFHLSELYRTETVNFRDLMAHRVGIPASDFHWAVAEITDRRELIMRSRFWKPILPYRSDYYYSNIFLTVAGVAAGKLYDMEYEEAMRAHLFEPLGMTNTTFMHQVTENDLQKLITPHQTNPITGRFDVVSLLVYSGSGSTSPAGNILSCAKDLVKWLQFQVNNGESPSGDHVMDEEALEETRRPQMPVGFDVQNYKPYSDVTYVEESYGLGWGLGSYRGYRMMQHGGALFGSWANAMVLPDAKSAIFICVNGPDSFRSSNAMQKIKLFTMDILLGAEPWVNVTDLILETNSHRGLSASDSNLQQDFIRNGLAEQSVCESDAHTVHNRLALAEYEGMYGHLAMGNLTVVHNNSSNELIVYFGEIAKFSLILVDDSNVHEHIFLAVSDELFWWFPPIRLIFLIGDITTEPYGMRVPIMLQVDPPVFLRDLGIEDGPPPPQACNTTTVQGHDSLLQFE